jgi:hypothetical protein
MRKILTRCRLPRHRTGCPSHDAICLFDLAITASAYLVAQIVFAWAILWSLLASVSFPLFASLATNAYNVDAADI